MLISLSKSDIKKLNSELFELYGIEPLNKKANIKLAEETYVMVENVCWFFYVDNSILPSLKLLKNDNFLKKVTVDTGAVKHLCSGADLMRPGITEIESGIMAKQLVAVVDEKQGLPIMIGTSLYDSEDMQRLNSGVCVRNVHHIGDSVSSFQPQHRARQ